MTFSKIKSPYTVNSGEKLCLVISLGYGLTQGISYKSKSMNELCIVKGNAPDWFKNGMDAAISMGM